MERKDVNERIAFALAFGENKYQIENEIRIVRSLVDRVVLPMDMK